MRPILDNISPEHINLLVAFSTGVLVTLAIPVISAIWHCPTNPFLGGMVQLREKRMRLSGQNGGFGEFEMKDHYGLEQQVLNLDFEPPTMWMNVGFWKNNPRSLSKACQALLEEVLDVAGAFKQPSERFSVLEVGCGCAEPARFLRQAFPDTFDQYIGVTLNGCQAAEATRRLYTDISTIDEAQTKEGLSDRNQIYCADAANPSLWPESLHKILQGASSLQEENTAMRRGKSWLLALDTLYHFVPDRRGILTYACHQMNASLMATDIIIPDDLSVLDWVKLRIIFFGLQVPWGNILSLEGYIRMLMECGYKRDNIIMIDITEHCFQGFDKFTREHMQQWEAMGGSSLISRSARMMGKLMGWWARSGTVREFIIVAKK